MDIPLDPYARSAGLALVVAGIAHLFVPDRLLRIARGGYATALNVRFDPQKGAERRVRLVGLGMVLAGAHLLYHGRVVPAHDG